MIFVVSVAVNFIYKLNWCFTIKGDFLFNNCGGGGGGDGGR